VATNATIGFIGLGKMGGNMAARYLAAAYTVYGEAPDRNGARWLVEQGLRWVESVAAGPDGVLAGLGAGKVWADLSTISPR